MKQDATAPIRVLMLLTDGYGGHGGIATYNIDVLESLAESDRIASVVALPRIVPGDTGRIPAKVTFDTSSVGGARAYITAVLRQVRTGRFDLVYCAHINLLPLAWLAAKLLRARLLLAIYGVEVWTPSRFFSDLVARRAKPFVLSISRFTLDRMREWCAIPDDRVALVPNAVHLDHFSPRPKNAALAARWGLTGNRVALTLGRLNASEQSKGFDHVIRAMPALLRHVPDLRYVIAGDGTDQPRLEALARDTGVGDAVTFTGRVDEAEKADLFALADVHVMPSKGEGFGFVHLEALASGVPTIASTIDGSREAVLEGELGAMVDPADQPALQAAILAALDAPRGVPERLSYFAFPRFRERLDDAIRGVMAR